MHPNRLLTLAALAALAPLASAQVFISEVFCNPPGSYDSTKEFFEFTGTPGMKLDGYAVCLVYGRQEKLLAQGIMPPQLADEPEIDEFLPLDGLSLGKNGILVIGIGQASDYPLLPDTNFANWLGFWSGPLDVANKLNNDGSTTILLVRNRPGMTPMNPFDPAGPLWVKDGSVDREITFGVLDPVDATLKDQIGNGKFDVGGVNVIGTPMFDYLGVTTPTNLDDLEVVDEVSWEHDRGWEYDLDTRKVDLGSTASGLEERNVHTLDDPQGINPDAITRVDYRTKGIGWAPRLGATGQLPNGNNWQDTATEQWLRGETFQFSTGGIGSFPFHYYDVAANVDPAALQPYLTNVPGWLADGIGADFAFVPQSYQILAGHVNALAVPFVPGDVDRDGDCDATDVSKVVGVFATAPWLFINSFASAPATNHGDPATQKRPWDVDGTGDNGIDPSDLQWVLNFQGNTNGRVVGVAYDATGPATTGVKLADPSSTVVTIDHTLGSICAPSLGQLRIHDVFELTVRGAVTSAANNIAGEQNGVMQFTHDVIFTVPGVMEVESVEALGAFTITKPSYLANPFGGASGGASRVNGYTTSFTQGLSGPAALYKLRIRAIAPGTTAIAIFPSADPLFNTSTPNGIKIGHSAANGDPGNVAYPALQSVTVTNVIGGYIGAYGAGCVGTGGFTPRLEGSGCATPGGAIDLAITRGLPGAVPIMFIGLGNASANLNPNCAIQNLPILPTPVVLLPMLGTGAGNGNFTIPGLTIPANVPLGVSTYLQMFFADAQGFGGIAATNPLRITFGN